jgi:DNA-binding MarR family transcriptional regulator
VVIGKGSDARSRLIHITEAGRAKRAEGQRHWKQAQLALNARLGCVAGLHDMLDSCTQRLQGADKRTAADCTG